MKNVIIVTLLLGFLGVSAHADQGHKSKQFEAMLLSCLPGGQKQENCLVETILKFTENPGLQRKVPAVIGELFDTIIGSRAVFAVHPVQSKILGDFIVEESYIIEKDNGGIALLQVAFLKTLGVWQISNVNLSSKDETIDEKLGVNI